MYLIDLFNLRILTFRRVVRLMMDVFRNGIQLSNVMRMCLNQEVVAIKHRDKIISYRNLFDQTASVSGYLYQTYRIKQGSNILIIIDNSIPSIVLMMAVSTLGCSIQIMGSIKDYDHFKRTIGTRKYDFIFCCIEEKLEYYNNTSIHFITPVWEEAISHQPYKPFVKVRTNLSIFTGGTTGLAKTANRSNTLWQYLRAIVDIVKSVRLQCYDSVILPVPIYHSYGLSALFLSLMLNKKLVLINKFDPAEVAHEIQANKIEVAILIPQMLFKLLDYNLDSVRCILSCSDVLPINILEASRRKFGNIIFNLYGTSESGLATIALPEMLAIKPDTIGRPIDGCELKLVNVDGKSILHVKSAFAMQKGYINTGDLVTRNQHGWFFFHGRADDLVIINGVNAYPKEIIEMAYKNEMIYHAVAKSYINEDGFKKLKLILQLRDGQTLNEDQFKDWWLLQYGTKFLPSAIEFREGDQHIKLMLN